MELDHWSFTPEIFNAIESTPVSIRSGRVELTDAINVFTKKGRVCPIFLDGLYYNINSVEDYNFANYNYRSNFIGTFKTSVIIPAYNEEESIGYVIRDFLGVNPHRNFCSRQFFYGQNTLRCRKATRTRESC